MTITIDVFVTTTPDGGIERIQAHSQGVDYAPAGVTTVNGIRKFTFQIDGDVDTTPAIALQVSDGVGVGENLG